MARTFTYDAIAFRQREAAPIQVAFVAPAGQVQAWAGVPRKSDELLAGYQRFKDDVRVNQEILPFFQISNNSSPTALIVALRKNSGIGTCRLENETIPLGTPVLTKLHITLEEEKLTTDAVFEAALAYLKTRLQNGSDDSITDEDADATGTPVEGHDDDEEEMEAEDQQSGDGEELINLGNATLYQMRSLIEDRGKWKNEHFRTAVADYVKPAFFIDGQHRAAAASLIGSEGLPFLVCGLFDAQWHEQVFQFTVVNLRPKRIPPALITSIAALSLTRAEQQEVANRLDQAGVKLVEVAVMSLVAYDDRSPFKGKVDMGVGNKTERMGLLGYSGVKRIALEWYRCTRTSLTQIARHLLATKNTAKARDAWRSEKHWFDFFCMFWNAIRDQYSELWSKKPDNQLFVAAHLWALQEVLLREADGQMRAYWDLSADLDEEARESKLQEKFLEVINTTLEYIPEEVWTTKWNKSGFDTPALREELVATLSQFVDRGKTSGRVWKAWKTSLGLFKS